MTNTIQISLCLTTYNRVDLTLRAFEAVEEDERIREIIIMDDGSERDQYDELRKKTADHQKVSLFRSGQNQGVYQAKHHAISLAFSDWCILLDSDNRITKEYIDALYLLDNWECAAYMPSFARPVFDYRHFAGATITKSNVASYMQEKMFDCLINTMNGFYNRQAYLIAFDDQVEPLTADSMYLNYLLLKEGNCLHVVGGLEYDHLVHDGSHYKRFSHKNELFRESLLYKYKTLV